MTLFQKYAAALLSAAVLIIGGIVPIVAAGKLTDETLAQLVVLSVTSVTTYFIPLVPVKLSGILKSGVEFLGAGLTLAAPYIVNAVNGTSLELNRYEVLIFVVALIKAFATSFGVKLRLDTDVATPVVPAQQVPAVVEQVNQGVPLPEAAAKAVASPQFDN